MPSTSIARYRVAMAVTTALVVLSVIVAKDAFQAVTNQHSDADSVAETNFHITTYPAHCLPPDADMDVLEQTARDMLSAVDVKTENAAIVIGAGPEYQEVPIGELPGSATVVFLSATTSCQEVVPFAVLEVGSRCDAVDGSNIGLSSAWIDALAKGIINHYEYACRGDGDATARFSNEEFSTEPLTLVR